MLKKTLIGTGCLALLIAGYIGFKSYQSYRDVKENTLRVESEMRFKQLVKEQLIKDKQIDSIASVVSQKQSLIDYMVKNPQVIIQNNDKIKIDIQRLDALNSIKLFTDNLSKLDSQRIRYSLHRFDKHN